jgi:hypothetical protein
LEKENNDDTPIILSAVNATSKLKPHSDEHMKNIFVSAMKALGSDMRANLLDVYDVVFDVENLLFHGQRHPTSTLRRVQGVRIRTHDSKQFL